MANLQSFGIQDVAGLTGISAYTIRYYDKCGFFPNLARSTGKVRHFSQADIDQLYLVDSLRKSGLSIEGIKYFVKLQMQGEDKASSVEEVLAQQIQGMELQIQDMTRGLEILKHEISRYKCPPEAK